LAIYSKQIESADAPIINLLKTGL